MEDDSAHEAVTRLVAEVSRWPGITTALHRFGGTAFRFGRGEIGHVHERGLLDVPFPRPVRDEIVAAGDARPHHTLPESGWVSFTIVGESDLDHALALLRRSYALRIAVTATRASDPEQADSRPNEDAVDEAVEESFPASDPPAVGGRDPFAPR